MNDNRIRSSVWLAVAGLLAVVFLVVTLLESRRSTPPGQEKNVAEAPVAPAPDAPQEVASRNRPSVRTVAPETVEPPPYIEGLVYGEIDLREARELMPDNIYWQRGSPTKDPAVLAEREAEKKRRNEEYGRVLAGDANEDEVRAYYDYQKRLSSDYLEFSEFMARRHRDSKNEQFVGLLELATKMHAAKLAELDGQLEDALQRSREREKIREDWRRQKEEFGEFPTEPSDEEE
ncbi:MAG: hypothetical protein ABR587_12045 [Candidatus Binatia bacterium]